MMVIWGRSVTESHEVCHMVDINKRCAAATNVGMVMWNNHTLP